MIRRLLLTAVVLIFSAGLIAQSGLSPDALLKRAMQLEKVDGDLAGAVRQYQEIVDRYPDRRAAVAQALFQIGGIQERRGRTADALTAYKRVEKEYPDTEPVTTARARIAALSQGNMGLVERKVLDDDTARGVSPDGRYLTTVDWDTGDLAVREILSGRLRRVTKHGSWNGDFAEGGAPSPNGRQIAYTWFTQRSGNYELRIVDLDDGEPRKVFSNGSAYVFPVAWTPDSQSLLVTIDRAARTPQPPGIIAFTATAGPDQQVSVATRPAARTRDLSFVNATTGQVRLIKQFEQPQEFQMNPELSPDGRFIAYSDRPAGRTERDIVLHSLETGRETRVIEHQADDLVLAWFPQGRRLLFASDRGGSVGIWAVDVDEKTGSEPVLVRKDAGNVTGLGFTRAGHFYYGIRGPREADIFIAMLSDNGLSTGPVRRMDSRFINNKVQGSWSPNGDRIAYVRTQPVLPQVGERLAPPRAVTTLGIQTVTDGDTREWSLPLRAFQNPAWFPDGRAVVVQGQDADGRQGLYQVDVTTGSVTPIALREPTNGSQRVLPAVAADGKHVFFRASTPSGTWETWLAVRELATGTERRIVDRLVSAYALSPDGTSVATLERQGNQIVYRLFVTPVAGGASRPVGPTDGGWAGTVVAWSADGKSLFLLKPSARGQDIWRVPLDGGTPVNTRVNSPDVVARLSVHPDGRRLALSASRPTAETRVLENIPALSKK